jgi:hypothetical protein
MSDTFGRDLEERLNEMLNEADLDVGESEFQVYALYDTTNGQKLSGHFDNRVDAYIHALRYLFDRRD